MFFRKNIIVVGLSLLCVGFVVGVLLGFAMNKEWAAWKIRHRYDGVIISKQYKPASKAITPFFVPLTSEQHFRMLGIPKTTHFPEMYMVTVQSRTGKRTMYVTKEKFDRLVAGDRYVFESGDSPFKPFTKTNFGLPPDFDIKRREPTQPFLSNQT